METSVARSASRLLTQPFFSSLKWLTVTTIVGTVPWYFHRQDIVYFGIVVNGLIVGWLGLTYGLLKASEDVLIKDQLFPGTLNLIIGPFVSSFEAKKEDEAGRDEGELSDEENVEKRKERIAEIINYVYKHPLVVGSGIKAWFFRFILFNILPGAENMITQVHVQLDKNKGKGLTNSRAIQRVLVGTSTGILQTKIRFFQAFPYLIALNTSLLVFSWNSFHLYRYLFPDQSLLSHIRSYLGF